MLISQYSHFFSHNVLDFFSRITFFSLKKQKAQYNIWQFPKKQEAEYNIWQFPSDDGNFVRNVASTSTFFFLLQRWRGWRETLEVSCQVPALLNPQGQDPFARLLHAWQHQVSLDAGTCGQPQIEPLTFKRGEIGDIIKTRPQEHKGDICSILLAVDD